MQQSHLYGILISALLLTSCGAQPPENLCDNNPDCLTGPADAITPIDGDTYQIRGQRFRLIGYDSPESAPHAGCTAEARLGLETEAIVQDLFDGSDRVQILFRGIDEYGRGRAHLYLDGINVGHLLAQQGLAQIWNEDRSEPKPEWCP